jgi:hypothetical protein
LGFLGEHKGLGPYNNDYVYKNINEIRHILKSHGDSTSRFELGLRNYDNNNVKKEIKKIKHKEKPLQQEEIKL